MRPYECDLDLRIFVLNPLRQLDVAGKSRSAGIKQQELIFLGNFDGFVGRDMVRRGIEQARSLQHTSRIRKPYRIPVRLDFASSRPARSCAAIKILKRGWVQEQGS